MISMSALNRILVRWIRSSRRGGYEAQTKKRARLSAAILPLPLTKPKFDVRQSFAAAFRHWRLTEKIPLKRLALDLGVSLRHDPFMGNRPAISVRFPV